MTNRSEQPVPFAPLVKLDNGIQAVPQHFLEYSHCRQSVESLLADVAFSEQFPLFVNHDRAGLYLQVGIIGSENYAQKNAEYTPKIVYGRKWRIEPNLPTSEILQTAFLAIQCAYEHELRELFRLRIHQGNHWATPFNSHFDLPLMAASPDLFNDNPVVVLADKMTLKTLRAFIEQVFARTMLGDQSLELTQLQLLGDSATDYQRCVIDIKTSDVLTEHSHLSALFGDQGLSMSMIEIIPPRLDQAFADQLLHGVMEQLIIYAQHYIAEHFMFRGFARFSRKNSVKKLAEFSFSVRNIDNDCLHPRFTYEMHALNCAVDESRVPSLSDGPLSNKNRDLLKKYARLEGYCPEGL